MSRRFISYTGACALLASAAAMTAIPAQATRSVDAPPGDDTSSFSKERHADLFQIDRQSDRPNTANIPRESGPATGDSCADPLVIPSIPFSTTGSTVGMADDYDEICTLVGFGGPDVVYQFDATEDVVVNISLCLNSNFDTRLYVYEDTCGDSGSVIACNEDQCPTPSNPDAEVSQIFDLQLFNGSSYYIVVDGFNGVSSGNYTLDITLDEAPCPEDSIFVQEHSMPDNTWVFGASDVAEGKTRAEAYSVNDVICGVRWWGLQLEFSGGFVECSEDPMSVTINFHEDDGGLPGAIACTFEGSVTPAPMGIYYFGFELQEFFLDLTADGCCSLTDGWISIIGGTDVDTDDTDCWFYWASSGDDGGVGAGSAVDTGGGFGSETYDLSFCLNTGDPTPPCPADVAGVSPGVVDVQDLLAVLSAWGSCPLPCPPNCPEDVVQDCAIDVQDLLSVLSNWGPCPPPPPGS